MLDLMVIHQEIDNLEQAILHSDYLVIVDDEKKIFRRNLKSIKIFLMRTRKQRLYI